jgi:type I restriction enzyme S subunit
MAEFFDGPHATPKPSEGGPIYLGIKNMTEDGHLDLTQVRHIAWEDFPRWTRRVEPRRGDLVFTYEASLHRYAMIPADFKGCLGRRTALIRPDTSVVDGRFLLYQFLGPQWRSEVTRRINIGSTVDRIPLIEFPKFPIRLPPLTVQRNIAAVLAAYDGLIENNLRRIELLEEMTQTVYREWFVNFRFPGHEDIPLVDSTLGPIPDGWEASTLGKWVELAYGKALKADERRGGDVPVLGSSGVVGWHDEHLVEGPGIVVGRKGHVGSVHWVDTDFYPIDTTFYVVSQLPHHYLVHSLRQQSFINSDAAVPGLNRNQAYSTPFVVPSTNVMDRFVSRVDSMVSLIKVLQVQIANLRATRDLLLPRLVSGEIDVSEFDIDTQWLAS